MPLLLSDLKLSLISRIDPYDGANFWMSNYTEMYVNLTAGKYRDVIAGQFYAHIHKDDFHLQVLDTQSSNSTESPINKSFAILVPSLSPIYANNPSFRLGYIDVEKQALLDYDQFYLDLVMATGDHVILMFSVFVFNTKVMVEFFFLFFPIFFLFFFHFLP